MAKELVARTVMVLAAAFAYPLAWWVPILAAPLAFRITNSMLSPRDRVRDPGKKLMLDLVTWLSFGGYAALCVYLFVRNIGGWYSWLLGVLAFYVLGILLGWLIPHRWHFERIEGDL